MSKSKRVRPAVAAAAPPERSSYVDLPVDEATVPEEAVGTRLDVFLAAMPSVGSRARAKHALQTGKVTVEGRPVSMRVAGLGLSAGAVVRIEWARAGSSAARHRATGALQAHSLQVLFEDAHVLAIDKPAGILTDTATRKQRRELDSVSSLARAYLTAQRQSAIVVHRLDRDTSGVVLLAKSRTAAENLQAQFRHHLPERTYWTLVQGGPEDDAGEWEDDVVWDSKNLVQRRAHPRERSAKIARANWTVRGRGADCAWLEVRLETGRRNQIRLQCQLRGHPLVGERLYTDAGWYACGPEAPRQVLHARSLVLEHPVTRQPLALQSALPEDIAEVFRAAQLDRMPPLPSSEPGDAA